MLGPAPKPFRPYDQTGKADPNTQRLTLNLQAWRPPHTIRFSGCCSFHYRNTAAKRQTVGGAV